MFQKGSAHEDFDVFIIDEYKDKIDPVDFFKAAAKPKKALRDDARSYVAVFEYEGQTFIEKIPREKDGRKWARFTTFFRLGEARRLATNLEKLRALGVNAPRPVLYMERRRRGMIVESKVIYRYATGRSLKDSDVPAWIEAVQNLHAVGWTHRDPHIENFLIDDGQVVLIDCSRARPWRNVYSHMHDYVLLKNSVSGVVDKELPHVARHPVYRLARVWNILVKRQRRLKQFFRNLFGVKRKYI